MNCDIEKVRGLERGNLTHLCVDGNPEVIWIVCAEFLKSHGGKYLTQNKPARKRLCQKKALKQLVTNLQTVCVDVETSELGWGNFREI
jgi:hypothetical protein